MMKKFVKQSEKVKNFSHLCIKNKLENIHNHESKTKQLQYNNKKNVYRIVNKTTGVSANILIVQLIVMTRCCLAQKAILSNSLTQTESIPTRAMENQQDNSVSPETNDNNNINTVNPKISLPTALSDLDKQVVERLIKQWSPTVWLAPEERFMPLGVEEFLAHVHPESKSKRFTPEMLMGEKSEKAFLVTNADIEELLENETSFIYGRNPNISPVPIYAVVTLCPTENEFMTTQSTSTPFKPFTKTVTSTKTTYIPIPLDAEQNNTNTIKRSSRLYPMLKRVIRQAPPENDIIPACSLVMGETVQSTPKDTPPRSDLSKEETTEKPVTVNNFIANLADNVKFSFPFNANDDSLNYNNKVLMYEQKLSPRLDSAAPTFHVTYWMFYPYSQGKNMCTLSLGPFGSIPFPAVYGYCLGSNKDIGSHIGDWEHMSLYFNGALEPEAMYVSAHDAGAYYLYNRLTGSFEFKRQETRKGILQRPNFPKTVTTFNDHPVLFAAKGSHGLWTAPGKHRFVKVARLYDINGFGTPWNTWKHVHITYANLRNRGRSLLPSWLYFKGKWGNPKSKCHPFRRIGLNFCEFTDGPTGIPLKEPHFQCGEFYKL